MAAPSKPATAAAPKITPAAFAARLKTLLPDLASEPGIAVALSGGGDSMALTYLLAGWAKAKSIPLHALTVDHGLRAEAAAEARQVGEWVADWGLTHKILKWRGKKPGTKIQEEARAARYRLLSEYCHKHKIRYLFLAHHANDQVETILFRLAKGSGLDGLSGMMALQTYDKSLTLVRPLLDMTHESLLAVCKKAQTPWVEDISNVSDRYARIRLRQSMDVLEAEGLTTKRILVLGGRLERARKALEQLTEKAWENSVSEINSKQVVFIQESLMAQPEELIVRLLVRALDHFRAAQPYPPRLEKVEDLVRRLCRDASFKAATLGGCIIRRHVKAGTVSVRKEA